MNRSIFKWPGGKYKMLPHIFNILPEGRRLVEPFAGGAVVSMNSNFKSYWLNDINKDLMQFYRYLMENKEQHIQQCEDFFKDENNNKEQYLKFRKLFNENHYPQLLLYLNRHGFNGLIRYNKKGGFNVPFGDYKKPYFPEKEMKIFMKNMKKSLMTSQDFREVFKDLKKGDVVYCDPPFLPISETANFTTFSPEKFTLNDQIDLATRAETAEVPVLISNADTAQARHIFRHAAKIVSVPSSRTIAAKGDSRKKVNEILALYT